MTLSQDSFSLLVFCSQLVLPEEVSPFKTREWTLLSQRMQAVSLSPAHLLGLTNAELVERLGLIPEEATRVALLAARADLLGHELERLASRGIYPITRNEPDYPERYRLRLKEAAPTVLFYAGEKSLLGQPGIAVVGSRNLDEAGKECANFVGNACGLSGLVLYSGGARGVDTISMQSALEARGTAVGVLADSLEGAVRGRRDALKRGDLCLVTPYSPNAGFSVGAAMGRNRLIYTLADYAIVVASDVETGGTWAGATEALKHGWLPVFVLEHEAMPDGNRVLLQKGALAFPHPFREPPTRLQAWLKEKSEGIPTNPSQPRLL